MIPIRDHNPARGTPWVTWGLIAANVAIFLAYWGLFAQPFRIAALFGTFGLEPAEVAAGRAPVTALTYMFLHGGVMHLLGNMLFLYIFGDNLEAAFGRLRFLAFYLASGIGAGLVQVLADPASTVPIVGASGAIAGVMGGYLLLFPRARIDMLVLLVVVPLFLTVPAAVVLILWFGLQMLGGLGGDGGIAWWAHAGGFVIGGALALPWWLARGGPAFWAASHGRPPNPEATAWRRSRIPAAGRRRLGTGPRRRGPWGG
jgi:membrane associated rhomboid family serine protease